MCTTQHTGRRHLTQEDRAVIEALHSHGETLRDIAVVIQKHYSTVSRELGRNAPGSGAYTAKYAQKHSDQRRLASRSGTRKIENDLALALEIETKLRGTHVRGGMGNGDKGMGISPLFKK